MFIKYACTTFKNTDIVNVLDPIRFAVERKRFSEFEDFFHKRGHGGHHKDLGIKCKEGFDIFCVEAAEF